MKTLEVRGLSDAELIAKKRDSRAEIFNLRLQQQTGRLEKPSRLRELKRDIAKFETVLSERRLALVKPTAMAPVAGKKKAAQSAEKAS